MSTFLTLERMQIMVLENETFDIPAKLVFSAQDANKKQILRRRLFVLQQTFEHYSLSSGIGVGNKALKIRDKSRKLILISFKFETFTTFLILLLEKINTKEVKNDPRGKQIYMINY